MTVLWITEICYCHFKPWPKHKRPQAVLIVPILPRTRVTYGYHLCIYFKSLEKNKRKFILMLPTHHSAWALNQSYTKVGAGGGSGSTFDLQRVTSRNSILISNYRVFTLIYSLQGSPFRWGCVHSPDVWSVRQVPSITKRPPHEVWDLSSRPRVFLETQRESRKAFSTRSVGRGWGRELWQTSWSHDDAMSQSKGQAGGFVFLWWSEWLCQIILFKLAWSIV